MREQLVSYIDLLFAAAPEAGEIKQEILQNTLDRYDDLIDQGKSPEAAYRLAISGIGDINEILSNTAPLPQTTPKEKEIPSQRTRLLRGIAVALYITCAIPLFILQNEMGLCLLLVMVAAATCLMVLAPERKTEEAKKEAEDSPRQQLRKSIQSLAVAITLVVYFVLSFTTGAWAITWLVFPIGAALKGIILACMDLKEANHHEN